MGLKFPPPLLLISSISLIISFSSLLFNSEDYLNGLFDMVLSSVIIIFSLKNLPLCSLLSFPPINYGSSMTLISIKAFLSVSMIVGNLIDVYLFGLIAVLINYLLYFICYSLTLISFPVYRFLTKIEYSILLLLLSESFSPFSQSLTISNRLSINLIPGPLLATPLLTAFRVFFLYFVVGTYILAFPLIIFPFEIINSFLMLIIYCLLFIEYSF